MHGWQTKCSCSNQVGSHFCNEHGGLVCMQSSSSPLGCHQTSYVLHLILEYVIGEGRKTFLLKFQMLIKQGILMAKNQPQATFYSLGVVP